MNRIVKMVIVLHPKKKHVVFLKRLFKSKPNDKGGFSKEDLEGIVRCEHILNLIKRSRTKDKKPWNPKFYWQVTEFPERWTGRDAVDGEVNPDDTVLAIAKDSEFCAVITIENDLGHIWYRMYKNDADVPGIFGSLMYAYTQGEDNKNCYSCIFISFMRHYGIERSSGYQGGGWRQSEKRPKRRMSPEDAMKLYGGGYSKIYMEFQHYDEVFCSQTYSAEVVHVDDVDEEPDEISFEDDPSEGAFDDAWDDARYPTLLVQRAGTRPGWKLGAYKLIEDCMRRPTVVGTLILGPEVLATEIARSVMLMLEM
jgi:hypothetical protein